MDSTRLPEERQGKEIYSHRGPSEFIQGMDGSVVRDIRQGLNFTEVLQVRSDRAAMIIRSTKLELEGKPFRMYDSWLKAKAISFLGS